MPFLQWLGSYPLATLTGNVRDSSDVTPSEFSATNHHSPCADAEWRTLTVPDPAASVAVPTDVRPSVDVTPRRRTADRIFRGTLAFNAALTLFWGVLLATRGNAYFFATYDVTRQRLTEVFFGILFFNVLWGFIWWGVKALLLTSSWVFRRRAPRVVLVADATAVRRRRVREPPLRTAHSYRRHGRSPRPLHHARDGRLFLSLPAHQRANPSRNFATLFLQDNLFDAVVTSWIFLAFYYSDGFLASAFYGPQSRVMDGVLARANCLLITTLWTAFKFVMVPLGAATRGGLSAAGVRRRLRAHLGRVHRDRRAARRLAGRSSANSAPRVGHRRRQSQVDRWNGVGLGRGRSSSALGRGRPRIAARPGLVARRDSRVSNTALELWSPRGTDDFTMATSETR